jgi:hypothetical protein
MFLTVLFAITSQVFASPITVSGTAYQGEGGTNIGFNKKVSLRVDGGGTFSDLTDFFGNYSITSVEVSPGSTITAWIDDDATYEGTTVRIANDPVGNISGLHIYGNRIIVRSDKTGTAVTNADLADYDEDNDPDIHFTCNSGNLVVDNDHELHIWTGDTFSPVGTVTTSPGGSLGGIHIGDSATFTAGGAISCGGSWTADTSSTFTPDGNAVIFTATAGGYSIITGGESFYDLTFNGPGGGGHSTIRRRSLMISLFQPGGSLARANRSAQTVLLSTTPGAPKMTMGTTLRLTHRVAVMSLVIREQMVVIL